ncbi:MAG: carboxypeptidase regulatory-like domain-containing protein [Bacteroidales bacterium]|nr:carboxypeptidase regulatory-like domain-containing protein [Bacteroidales bacterium]
MKTLKLFLGVVCASLFLLASCVKDTTPETGSIQGIVTNESTNEPIQGVNISLSPTGLSAVTGSDGRYEFNNLDAGQYTVQGVKVGFESNTKNITIVAGNVSSGDMTLKPEVTSFRLNVDYLDFGTNFSSLNFKIINTSTSLPINWSISESMGWLTATPSSGNLNAGQEVVVMVTIDRDQIEQNTTANLTVTAADQNVVLPVNVSVSGSNSPHLQLSETSLDFGTSANSLAFYVMNTGPVGTSLNWTCSNINVDWLMISPTSGNTDGGSSTPVMATIDRTKIDGMVSTSVTISGAGSSATISISAATEGAGAAILQLSEGSIDFGENETTKTFQVKNVGSAGTVLDWTIATPSVDWLTLTPMTGHTNAGSGTQVTAVIDRNKVHGMVSTTITVSGSNNSANLSVSAANYHPNLEVPVTSVDFGKMSSSETIQIKNTGDEGSTLSYNIVAPSVNWLTVSPMSGTINANQSKTVNLTIDRTKFDGDVSTTITITSGDQSAIVNIMASTANPTMNVSVTSVDFGTTSSSETFQIRNTGETGSLVNWSIATPSVSWLTVSPMSGSASANSPSTVTLTVDRNAFVGNETTEIIITGAGSTATVSITVDNTVIVTNGLMAYYNFDEGTVTDLSGNNFNGFNQGASSSSDTPNGQGLSMEFDGNSSYLQIPYVLFPTSGAWSYNMWFKTDKQRIILGTNLSYYTHFQGIAFGGYPLSNLTISPNNTYSWGLSGPITTFLNNQWHMLTVTYTGSVACVYIDGALFETCNHNNLTWWSQYTRTYIGTNLDYYDSYNTYYEGKMDNIRTYNRALTAAEVQTLFNAKQ